MRRLNSLDALRGVAALMVFVHHVQLPGLHPATIGFDAGVLIFFSLSGYLLYAPFVRSRNAGIPVNLVGYAIRRAARILPAYLVAAFVISAIWYPFLLADPIAIALGTATPIVVVWTLLIEAEFYVALPVLAWLIGRVEERHRIVALMVLAAFSIGTTVTIMVITIRSTGIAPSSDLETLVSYVWAFVPGMILAELQEREHLARPLSSAVPALGLMLIGASVVLDPPPFFDVAASVGSGMLIGWLISRRQFVGRVAKVSVALGALSYPVYLWHVQIIDLVDRPASWGGAILALAITVGIAAVSYLAIERPAIRLGHRIARVGWRRSQGLQLEQGDSGTGVMASGNSVVTTPDVRPSAPPRG